MIGVFERPTWFGRQWIVPAVHGGPPELKLLPRPSTLRSSLISASRLYRGCARTPQFSSAKALDAPLCGDHGQPMSTGCSRRVRGKESARVGVLRMCEEFRGGGDLE